MQILRIFTCVHCGVTCVCANLFSETLIYRNHQNQKQYELLCRKSRCKPVKMVFDMLKIQTLMLQDAHTCALVQLKILYQLLSSGEAVLFNVHLAMGNKQLISARQRQKFRTDQRAELLGLILG